MRNPASLRSFIWAEVGAHGLYLPDRTLDTCLLALAGRGRWLWEHVFSPTLGARLPGLYGPATATEQRHEAGRIGGFSSIYCEHLQRALGARPDARASSGAAWLALAVTSLDRAIDVDGGGDALAELRRLSRSGALARALREPVSLDGPHLPPSLVPGLAALDACFANVRSLAAEAGAHGAALVDELAGVLDEALTAELATTQLRFERRLGDDDLLAMRAANTLPQWIAGYLAFLAVPAPDPARRDAIEAVTVDLGDVMWTLDDLCDAAEDLANGVWSRVWWTACERAPELRGLLVEPPAALAALERSSAIPHLVGQLATRIDNVAACSALDPAGVTALATWARVMTWSWLLPWAAP
jgi:hypothetical protein